VHALEAVGISKPESYRQVRCRHVSAVAQFNAQGVGFPKQGFVIIRQGHLIDKVQCIEQPIGRLLIRRHQDGHQLVIVEIVRIPRRQSSACEELSVRLKKCHQQRAVDPSKQLRAGKVPKLETACHVKLPKNAIVEYRVKTNHMVPISRI